MTNKEARDILMRWVRCQNRDIKFCSDTFQCEGCEYNHTDEEVFEALDVAIEELELIEWMEHYIPSVIRHSRELKQIGVIQNEWKA